MKKIALILCAALVLGVCCIPAFAAEDRAVQTVRALGIMVGDNHGNMNLEQKVTRAQFAKMLVAASPLKDTVNKNGAAQSVFTDVRSTHWASDYIRIAASQGYFVGYTDGTFKPDKNITLEEGCTAVLRVLGFDSSNLTGAFPTAQLNKASSIGLRDGMTLSRGDVLLRSDCAQIFCNMMTAKNAQGKVHATELGYQVINGEVNYTAAIYGNMNGPYIAKAGDKIPFTPSLIYRNGEESKSAALSENDVYYYNSDIGTALIYTEKVSGKITAVSPNSKSPTSVTIAGKTYQIGSSDATYALSSLDGDITGKTATLLLGIDDAVVGVLTGSSVNSVYYGIVQSVKKEASADGSAEAQSTLTVFCTDGAARTFSLPKTYEFTAGKLVSVSVNGSGVTVSAIADKTLSGKVSGDGKTFAGYMLEENARIIDTAVDGAAAAVKVTDIAGKDITASSVRFYTLSDQGRIKDLILNDTTGELWTYGYCTSAAQNGITLLVNGERKTVQGSFTVGVGGVAVRGTEVRQMTGVTVTSLSASSLVAENVEYAIADTVQVYLKQGNDIMKTTLSQINTSEYAVTGYYNPFTGASGRQIRIIVASKY